MPQAIVIGGGRFQSYEVPDVRLAIGSLRWSAGVAFVDDWPFDHAVLGTTGFFDHWSVRFDAAAGQFSLLPRGGDRKRR